MTICEFIIEPEEVGIRLDLIISVKLSISRNQAQKYLANGNVSFGEEIEKNPAKKTKNGDFYRITIPDPRVERLKACEKKLNIIFEDQDLLVIDKPANLTVHPGAGNYQDTLANILINYLGENLSDIGGPNRPGILHRLDKDTSGLMIIAKNNESHLFLAEQIKLRSVKRHYLAIVVGQINPPHGKIEKNLARSKTNFKKMAIYEVGGKFAVTYYQVLKYYDNIASLVQFNLETGRTHQIRLHSSSIGFPLVGDSLYSGRNTQLKKHLADSRFKYIKEFPRQALHSQFLSFKHPRSLEVLSFQAEPPEDFKKLLEILENNRTL